MRGLILIGGTAMASLALIVVGQPLLRLRQTQINPSSSPGTLWRHYRWSTDPEQRREAALSLSHRADDAATRQRLLAGQGWGRSALAAVSVQRQADTAAALGQREKAAAHWSDLLRRFPSSAASADARYHLSAGNPDLQQQLRQQQPAHPAALDSAVRDGDGLHLARWGPKHPGAGPLIRAACDREAGPEPSASDRNILARALAARGDGAAALRCLQGATAEPATMLAIGTALLNGSAGQRAQGQALLLQLTQRPEATAGGKGETLALEAAAQLSAPLKPDPALLAAIPQPVRDRSADVAAAEVRLGQRQDAEAVLQRWPAAPASWQLQWDLAREALLKGQWRAAARWLGAIPASKLPEPLAARQQFWLGLAKAKQDQRAEAEAIWQRLIKEHPPGYYTWRAASRLEGTPLPSLQQPSVEASTAPQPESSSWEPLNSGDAEVDTLWRLELTKAAWETWRSRHPESEASGRVSGSGSAPSPAEGLVEGQLRLARGDSWNGLERLWRSSLRLVDDDCSMRERLHRSQHPRRYQANFAKASEAAGIRSELPLAIAKQESRFSPAVASPVGAVGLMQLMPATANAVAGRTLNRDDLEQPELNARLGSRYLAWLLRQWNGNPWLAIASYNAGPGAAGSWRSPELQTDPELWVERIPYPETRLYTKKVLGNLWAYLNPQGLVCPPLK